MKHWSVVFSLLIYSWEGRSSEMVTVPSGELNMFWLSPSQVKEKSKRKAHIRQFQVMALPVQVESYKKFLKSNSGWEKDNISTLYADEHYLKNLSSPQLSDKSPMTNISWFAARAYCESQGLRLPTVIEWEYMAAASEKLKDANKDPLFLQRILDWYGETKGNALPKAGSIYKNMYGIWDLHGLIWEWVEDFNSTFVTGESREDSSFNKNMFCGAGALNSGDKENYAAFMRFGFRSSLKGASSIWNLGFRCVRSI